MRWVAKRVEPESIIGICDTEDEARELAESRNRDYQTGNYIWEPYDPEKVRKGWSGWRERAEEFKNGAR